MHRLLTKFIEQFQFPETVVYILCLSHRRSWLTIEIYRTQTNQIRHGH